jgi:hypothetical protein
MKASLVIIPGSSLSAYSNIKEINDLIVKLRQVFN